VVSAPTGFFAQQLGWEGFFVICTLMAIPGMLLLLKFSDWQVHPIVSQPLNQAVPTTSFPVTPPRLPCNTPRSPLKGGVSLWGD
jgi:hypothetical protein